MKTSVSIPDEVFNEAERLASDLRTSRSQLYSRALCEFITRHAHNQVTDAMNKVISDLGEDSDEFSQVAAHQLLERID
jgi:metal-responsive CopG/Arc/MetJ family transcriptional regulator